jgi:hypothetical protein
MGRVLEAIQQGSMFRDMSRGAELATLLGNLASVAERSAANAGTLAGTAATEALKSATDLAKSVAQLVEKTMTTVGGLKPPENVTHEGGRENLEKEKPKATEPKAETPTGRPAPAPRPTSRSVREVPVILSARWESGELLKADFSLVFKHERTKFERAIDFRTSNIAGYASRDLQNPSEGDWSVFGNVLVVRPPENLIHAIALPLVGGGSLNLTVDLSRELPGGAWVNCLGRFLLQPGMDTIRLEGIAHLVTAEADQEIELQVQAGAGVSAEAEAQLKNALLRIFGGEIGVKAALEVTGQASGGQTTRYKLTYYKLEKIELTHIRPT